MAARYFLASRENMLLYMLYPIKKFPLVLLTIGIQDHLSGSSTVQWVDGGDSDVG